MMIFETWQIIKVLNVFLIEVKLKNEKEKRVCVCERGKQRSRGQVDGAGILCSLHVGR